MHPSLETIIQKYSEKGHSCIQEVDAAHSNIERIKKPLSLVSLLTKLRKQGKTFVLQMKQDDFLVFQNAAKTLHTSSVPYPQIKQFKYTKTSLFILLLKRNMMKKRQQSSLDKR